MAEDDKFQKMETFRRFLKEPLPPLVKKYISNGHWKYFETFVNVIETTFTRIEKYLINKNVISTDNTVAGNSRSEGNEKKSLQPKLLSVKYRALNLPKIIITYHLKK